MLSIETKYEFLEKVQSTQRCAVRFFAHFPKMSTKHQKKVHSCCHWNQYLKNIKDLENKAALLTKFM